MPNAAVEAIKFSLESDQGDEFIAYWNEGEFDKCRRNWPDAPDECYFGADPLFKPVDKLSLDDRIKDIDAMFDSLHSTIGAELSDCEVCEYRGHTVVMAVSRELGTTASGQVRHGNVYIDGATVTYERAIDILSGRPPATPPPKQSILPLD